jgi:hypothetical protein
LLILLTPQVLTHSELQRAKPTRAKVTDEQCASPASKTKSNATKCRSKFSIPCSLRPEFEEGKPLPKPEPLPIPQDSKL